MRNRLLLPLALLGALQMQAAIIYVDIDANGSENGTSWSHAFTDLQDALAVAVDGDDVWVAEGVYKPTLTTDREIAFNVPPGVDLFGGFAGNELSMFLRNWAEHPTVLSGAIGSPTTVTDNSYNVVEFLNATGNILDGFEIRRAYLDVNLPYSGAVAVVYGTAVIRHCLFHTNRGVLASSVNAYNAEVSVISCLFRDNHAPERSTVGGYGSLSSLQVIGCTFSQNEVGLTGEQIWISGGDDSVVVSDCIIWGNTGGGITGGGTEANISDCIIQGGHWTGENLLDVDPEFQDPLLNDFRLKPQSPAIHKGVNIGGVAKDLAGNDRVWDSVSDWGCFEYSASNILFVDDSASGANDGSSWTDAFTDLNAALAAFSGNELIYVAAGVYVPTASLDRTAAFEMHGDMQVFGGFEAGMYAPSVRNLTGSFSFLSGDIGTFNDYSDNSMRIVHIDGPTPLFTLDGFTITRAYNDGLDVFGGAVLVENGPSVSVRIQQCSIQDNNAPVGAALAVRGGTSVQLRECLINANCTETWAENVMTVAQPDLQVYLEDNTFSNNDAQVFFLDQGEVTITGCSFASNDWTHGVVLQDFAGSWTVEECSFDNNTSTGDGAVFAFSGTTGAHFRDCVFEQNAAGGSSGVAVLGPLNTAVVFEQCLFDNNSGFQEALFRVDGGDLEMHQCTVVNQICPISFEVQPAVIRAQTAILYVTNSIFWSNLTVVDVDGFDAGTLANNIVRSDAGSGNVWFDPQFVDAVSGDYSLGPNSPAQDAADPAWVSTTVDFAGEPRVVNNVPDLGIFERQSCSNPLDACDNGQWLVPDTAPVFGTNRCANSDDVGYGTCDLEGEHGVWYTFTASTPYVVVVLDHLSGIEGDFDPILTASQGVCISDYLACANDLGVGEGETLVLGPLEEGSYQIKVEGHTGQEGRFSLAINGLDGPPESACPEDLDVSGDIGTGDLLEVLGAFGCTDACIEDLDGDGTVSTGDLLQILGEFGVECTL